MLESDESAPPSNMDFQDLLDMALASPDESLSSNQLTTVEGATSVPGPSQNMSFDIQINYHQPIIQRIGSLIETGALTDVKFLIGEEKVEIRAHKLILALSSPVFTSMFYSALESQDVVQIPDCRPDAFQKLIQYLYKGEQLSSMDVNQALSILYTARKYAVRGLEDICAVTLSSSISPENVFEILQASSLYCLPTLEAECWEFLQDRLSHVLDCHLEYLDYDMLILILKDDRLNIREVELFEFLMRWAANECKVADIPPSNENKMQKFGKALELIRFPTMTCTEFADHVVPTGILTVDQIAKIFTYISASLEKKEAISMEFPINPRQPRCDYSSKQSHGLISIHAVPTFVTYDNQVDRNENEVETQGSPTQRNRSRRSARRSRRRNR